MEDQIASLIEMLNALSKVKFSVRIILHKHMHLLPLEDNINKIHKKGYMTALLDIENNTKEITSHPIFILNVHVTIPCHIDIIYCRL